MSAIPTVRLPTGETVPALGQGTWTMGDSSRRRKEEAAALRLGLDLGMTLIDTAEMYASGGAEEVVADAIAGRRDEVFVVSKVMPTNASRRGTVAACEKSLKRLKVEAIDLYLLHWPANVPIAETVDAFTTLKRAGKIRHWGVSNFDTSDMQELKAAPAANQVLYNLTRRGIEWDLLPWCEERRVLVMAYSPIEQGRILRNRALAQLARARGCNAAQLALAWVLNRDGVVAIPKATRLEHVRDNRAALDIVLSSEERAALDATFPPPDAAHPLEML